MLRCLFGLAIAALLTGCGSSSSSTTTPATSPPAGRQAVTRAQFIAQADALCQTAQNELAPLKARIESLSSSSETATALRQAAALLRQSILITRATQKKLEALARPPADTATIEKMLTGMGEETTYKKDAADAVTKHEPEQFAAVKKLDVKAKSFDEGLAQGYGLKVCGRSE
jgi:hypothetical protein